jgi:hypothetical protein
MDVQPVAVTKVKCTLKDVDKSGHDKKKIIGKSYTTF